MSLRGSAREIANRGPKGKGEKIEQEDRGAIQDGAEKRSKLDRNDPKWSGPGREEGRERSGRRLAPEKTGVAAARWGMAPEKTGVGTLGEALGRGESGGGNARGGAWKGRKTVGERLVRRLEGEKTSRGAPGKALGRGERRLGNARKGAWRGRKTVGERSDSRLHPEPRLLQRSSNASGDALGTEPQPFRRIL